MHDIRLIRDDPEAFDAAIARRGLRDQSKEILRLDGSERDALRQFEELKAQANATNAAIGIAMKSGEKERALHLKAEGAQFKVRLGEIEARVSPEHSSNELLAGLPNLPAPDVPAGADEADNVEQKAWGRKRQFNYAPANHADLGPALGLDFETGAMLSGARFTFLRGQMARLQRALGQFMLDRQTAAGFTECAPPLLVRDEAMFGTGQLPKFENDSFATGKDPYEGIGVADEHGIVSARGSTKKDRMWLIPTSEVSLTNSVREQILADDALPIKMTALTPCFRSEAGSAGKDTRGYIRQHQFEKVELVTICRPDDSAAEHENMTLAAEAILEALDLPYRRMLLCAGDMGFSARKTYDLEVWLPGQDAYREISSISNCGDFQARRMNARYRPEVEKGTQFVHTLNGSGLAVGRTLVAVLENYQQEDGSVQVPEVLVPYMGGVTKLTANA